MATSKGDPVQSLLGRMQEVLTVAGYECRANVALADFPDLQETAALIGYDEQDPVVLCYPVPTGKVVDPGLQEAAKFQAGAVSSEQSAQYVWLSDGEIDYYYVSDPKTSLTVLSRESSKTSLTVSKCCSIR